MILIADCHASHQRGNEAEFLALLEAVAATSHDVVFLGDILDLWIALPQYEQDLHRRFLNWCRRESGRRTVGFVEGNHEFFVAHRHADAFSFCSPAEHVDGAGRLYVHGDAVNRADRGYLLFRAVTRSAFIRWAEQVTPGAPAIARFVKRHMNARREALPKVYPDAQVAAYAHAWHGRGVRTLYLGHFHEARIGATADGDLCQVLPAWCGSGLVGLVSPGCAQAQLVHWRTLA
jgi:UDP-2,3-diacylglucosamine pyrophosphatase LpxH